MLREFMSAAKLHLIFMLAGAGPIWLCVQPELESLSKLPNSREAYRLSSTDSGILIQAQAAHGLFNGVQTLLQLLPPTEGQDIQLENMQASWLAA